MGAREHAEELRAALSGRGGRGRAYPVALRRLAVAYFVQRRDEGAAVDEIGPEIGISSNTLSRWEQDMRGPDEPSRGFEVVHVVEDAVKTPSRGLVVHGPSGLRVEGLDVDSLAELLRRLG